MRRLAFVSLVFFAPPLAAADDAPKARTADQILADYARAIGGEAAFKKHKSVHMKRERTIKSMGLTGTEERWATADGKALQIVTLPGIGTFKQGGDSKVQWTLDPINGLRKLDGAEAEEALIEARWDAEVRLAKVYAKVRAVPPPAGQSGVECVELSPKIGKPSIACFDATTHLRVSQEGVQPSPQGFVPYQARFSDWREVDGVKLPWKEELSAGPVNTEARVLDVKFGEKIDPSLFKLPKADAAPPK